MIARINLPKKSRHPGVAKTLTSDAIHLWLTFYEEISEDILSSYRELLSEMEKIQELRFYFATDRRRYLVTRALVRMVLSQYVSVAPEAWQFTSNAYGRPEIANAEAAESGLSFNISHAPSLIVLGITKSRALGVDVENWRSREINLGIASHFFSSQEVCALRRVPKEHQRSRFFEYWTLKESYIKARGMGLSIPLDKFGFHYPCDDSIEICIDPELGDTSGRWQFWQLRPAADYVVAVCAERIDAKSPELVLVRTVPGDSEAIWTTACCRISV
jgi:4'-phosphopantetheinyl transferase